MTPEMALAIQLAEDDQSRFEKLSTDELAALVKEALPSLQAVGKGVQTALRGTRPLHNAAIGAAIGGVAGGLTAQPGNGFQGMMTGAAVGGAGGLMAKPLARYAARLPVAAAAPAAAAKAAPAAAQVAHAAPAAAQVAHAAPAAPVLHAAPPAPVPATAPMQSPGAPIQQAAAAAPKQMSKGVKKSVDALAKKNGPRVTPETQVGTNAGPAKRPARQLPAPAQPASAQTVVAKTAAIKTAVGAIGSVQPKPPPVPGRMAAPKPHATPTNGATVPQAPLAQPSMATPPPQPPMALNGGMGAQPAMTPMQQPMMHPLAMNPPPHMLRPIAMPHTPATNATIAARSQPMMPAQGTPESQAAAAGSPANKKSPSKKSSDKKDSGSHSTHVKVEVKGGGKEKKSSFLKVLAKNPKGEDLNRAFAKYKKETGKDVKEMSFKDINKYLEKKSS